MAITKENPRTIHLGGSITEVNDVAASTSITPGMLVERHSVGGVPKFRPHSTAGGPGQRGFALNMPELNKSYTDPYAAGDLVKVGIGHPGATFLAWVASGANLAAGALLESAGNGKLRAVSTGTPLALVVEDLDNTAGPGDASIRVEAL